MKLFLLNYITLFSSLYLQLLICTDIRRKNKVVVYPFPVWFSAQMLQYILKYSVHYYFSSLHEEKNNCSASGLCVMGTHLPALVTIISVPSWLNSSHKAFISN